MLAVVKNTLNKAGNDEIENLRQRIRSAKRGKGNGNIRYDRELRCDIALWFAKGGLKVGTAAKILGVSPLSLAQWSHVCSSVRSVDIVDNERFQSQKGHSHSSIAEIKISEGLIIKLEASALNRELLLNLASIAMEVRQ